MTCQPKRYIIVPIQGVPGPVGPPGPAGPPGESVQLPIAAEDISVTNLGFSNQQALNDHLLYTPIVISSFSTPVDIYEIGSTVTSLTFNWILNRDPISQTLTGPLITPPTLTVSQRSATLVVSGLTGTTPGDSFPYVLETTDETAATVQATENVKFYNGVYYGDADIPGAIDSNFINSLTKNLQLTRARTWTTNSTGTQYAWYAHRKDLGLATFSVGGFPGGFEAPVTVSFTNGNGFTEDYYVYRSTNPSIGPVNITAS